MEQLRRIQLTAGISRNVATNTRVLKPSCGMPNNHSDLTQDFKMYKPAIKSCPHKIPLFTILQVGGLDDSSRSHEGKDFLHFFQLTGKPCSFCC